MALPIGSEAVFYKVVGPRRIQSPIKDEEFCENS